MFSPEYLAGLFDGEGCVNIWRNKRNNSYCVRVTFSMTNKEIIENLEEQFGGSIQEVRHVRENHKPFWIWNINGKRVTDFLEYVKPYVFIKTQQVEVGLVMRKLMEKWQKGKALTFSEITKRRTLKKKMNILNKRGVK